MYKLTVVGILLALFGVVYGMVWKLPHHFAFMASTGWPGLMQSMPIVLIAFSRLLLCVAALYWVPKLIKKFFPEVS